MTMLLPAHDAPPARALDGREDEIRRLLSVAKSVLGLDVAWMSQFTQDEQIFRYVDAGAGAANRAPLEGDATALDGSFCVRVLEGRLPSVVPDASAVAELADLPVTRQLGIGSYVGVPMMGRAGNVLGMLCCTGSSARPELDASRLPLITMLADVIAGLLQDDAEDKQRRRLKISALIAGEGRRHVVQPIVDIRTGQAVGAEALTRFDDSSLRPDQWFAEAEAVGLLTALELAAARSGLGALQQRPGYISVNASPQLVASGGLDLLLEGVDRRRIVVELTEHAAVSDYAGIAAALAPHRAAGLRLAIDDAGAGYASFRHILELRPEYIKVDLSLTRDIHLDPVRQALVTSLQTFARTVDAQLIAEGVESQAELDALARLGVTRMQGYYFSKPVDAPPVAGYATPTRHVIIDGASGLAVSLADSLRRSRGLDDTARACLDALLAVTGLETSYLSLLSDGVLEQRYVRNAGALQMIEGATAVWAGSPCSLMQQQQRRTTSDALTTLADSPLVRHLGIQTYLTIPLRNVDGRLIGTLCGAAGESIHISEQTLAVAELVARVLGAELCSSPTWRP